MHPRKDNAELLELTIIILGDVPHKGVYFVKPGAIHRERWMSRVLYGIKNGTISESNQND